MQIPGTQRTVAFFFEGRVLRGNEGEPIAKALFTAGVRTLSYSVKYKRPRGNFCARGRCVACHMSVDGVPGVPTCITPLREGMRIEREGYRPFYSPLATAFIRLFPFPAGFYYRMFTRPAWLQKIFLGSLRRMAGVGRLPLDNTSVRSTTGPGRSSPLPVKDAYDVVVVGSGMSGMAAALSSAHHGSEVLLVDECRVPGGHSIGYQSDTELTSARDQLIERIKGHVAVEHRPDIVAYGFYLPNALLLGPGGPTGMKRVVARSFVFATGANDVVPLFENNDTPGIFGERAIRLLLERDRWRPGRKAVVYGAGEALHATVNLLLHHGIEVAAVVDPTGAASAGGNRGALHGIRTITNAKITTASGGAWLRAVEVSRSAPSGSHPGSESGARSKRTEARERVSLACDLLCISLPGQPAYELPHQAGFEYALSESPIEEFEVMRPVTRFRTMGPEPGRNTISFFIVGEASGDSDWRKKIEGGERAGAQAAGAARA
jgi:sarcosine oxidase subunit alpha